MTSIQLLAAVHRRHDLAAQRVERLPPHHRAGPVQGLLGRVHVQVVHLEEALEHLPNLFPVKGLPQVRLAEDLNPVVLPGPDRYLPRRMGWSAP